MILETKNIVSGYGPIEILHEVSIQVEEKAVVSIIGPNGAGKSTLFKTLVGLLKPSQGSIIFEGEDITGLETHKTLRRGLTYVPQGRNVFPDMTVRENLEMGAFIIKDDNLVRERLKEVYERFPVLKEKENQRAGYLSGGEQQMVEMGRALMLKPKLILLDEPSLGLAPKVVKIVFDKIQDLNKAGTTLVIVEQNAYRALQISDWGYVLDLGRVRFEGTGKDLLNNKKVRKLYLGG